MEKPKTKKILDAKKIQDIMYRFISLTDLTISDTAAIQLVESLRSIHVDSFLYTRNEGVGLLRIAQWLHASSVTRLQMFELNKNEVTLVVFNLPKNLVHLNLSTNEMVDDDMVVLAMVLENISSLISLNLSGNKIGNIGAKVIANMLPGSMVTYLNLSDNKIGDEGGSALLDVLPRSKVKIVEMCDNDGMSKDIENEFDEYMDILRLVETSQNKRFKLTVV
jgi:Leucine-rich repeat (LRR) protein